MNNTKRNLLLRLVFILVTPGALVWAVYGYLHNYNTLATWQKNLYVIIIVCAIPALFLLLFTGRIERKYGVKEEPNSTDSPAPANMADSTGTTETSNSGSD